MNEDAARFWGALAMTALLFSQASGISLHFPLQSASSSTFLIASFFCFARTSNFLQWGKIPAHLHLPPSIVTVSCVWGLTLLHRYHSLLSVSSWNSFDGKNWMNPPGFSSHPCGTSVWEQPPASCRSLAHECSTISHVLPVASDILEELSSSLWPGP